MNPTPATTRPEARPAHAGLVAFVGVGPGDEGLLTLRAAELLAQADLVVGRPELTGPLAHRLPERAVVAEPADPGTDTGRLTEAASAGRLAVRLFAGDPLLFSRASQQADACARARVRVEIVPGVSAATGVPGLRRHPADRRHRRPAGGARIRPQPARRAHARQPGRPRCGGRAGQHRQDAGRRRLGGHHPDRPHLERDYHRSAHGGQQAGVGRGRPQGGRGEHADRARSGPGRDRRGGRS